MSDKVNITKAAKVVVKFNKNYCASRGEGIVGAKDVEKEYPLTDALRELIAEKIVTVVAVAAEKPDEKREKRDAK